MFTGGGETANAERALEDSGFFSEVYYGLAIINAKDAVDLDDILLDGR